ncbi:MAG: DUF3822 family protein [Saprospiraceae bacterium]
MDKHFLDLKDGRLTAESAPQVHLYAVLGTESVSLMGVDATDMVLAVETWHYAGAGKPFALLEGDVRRLLKESAIWGLSYSQIHGCLFHPYITLVPRRLFQHGDLSGYFKLLLPSGDFVYAYEELPELDAYLVSATEKAQANLFNELFPSARHRHLAAPLLRFVRETSGAQEHTVFLNLRHQTAQVIVLERQNLLFYNTFQFATASDLLYYALLVYDQFRLKPAEIPLLLAGTILPDSELYRVLYRFVREMQFVTPPGLAQSSSNPETLPAHCLVDLFCLKKY